MRTVFLSCHFGESDRALVRQVEGLLESHNLRIVTGEELGGGALTPEVMARIEKKSDALVALMTRRNQPDNYCGTHPWVVDEFKHAKGHGKRAIALVSPDVTVTGAYQDHERINFDPDEPLTAFIRLSKTIGLWKSEAGRIVRAQVLPDKLANQVAIANGACHCSFRLHAQDGTAGDWHEAPSRAEGDGTYIYLNGVTDDALIQVRVEVGGVVWTSRVLLQSMPVELTHR
jgi:hypothetical protein